MRDIKSTEVNIFRLEHKLFRSDKLVDRNVPASNGTSPNMTTATPNSTVASTAASTVPSTGSPFSTFAQAISQKVKPASPPPQITVPLAPRSANAATKRAKEQAAAQPKWNPGARGLDKPIPVVQSVLEAVKRRKDNNKICNNHFLRGPCSKGDSCSFVHNYKPTADELDAIAFLTRLNPCTLGQDCEAEDCIYGHHVSGPGTALMGYETMRKREHDADGFANSAPTSKMASAPILIASSLPRDTRLGPNTKTHLSTRTVSNVLRRKITLFLSFIREENKSRSASDAYLKLKDKVSVPHAWTPPLITH